MGPAPTCWFQKTPLKGDDCSVAMPQHVPQSLPNPPCVECLFNYSFVQPNDATLIM